MAKRKKILLIVFGFCFLSCVLLLTVSTFGQSKTIVKKVGAQDTLTDYYTSSRFTKVDDLTVNTKKGADLIETIDEAGNLDQLIHQNDRFEMYFNERLNIVKLKNKESGYVWSSALDKIDKTFLRLTTLRFCPAPSVSVISSTTQPTNLTVIPSIALSTRPESTKIPICIFSNRIPLKWK